MARERSKAGQKAMLRTFEATTVIFVFGFSLIFFVPAPARASRGSACIMVARYDNSCQVTRRHTPTPPRHGHSHRTKPHSPPRASAPRSSAPKTKGCTSGKKKVACASDNGFWSHTDNCYENALVSQSSGADGSLPSYLCVPATGTPSVVRRAAPPPTMPVVTQSDFQKFSLPAPRASVQPDGWTVTGYPTNMYTNARETTINLTILGFAVRVRARPVSFSWNFGDGHSLVTHSTGAKIAPGDSPAISHVYARSGHVRVVLTTRYSGEYSVAGGAWLPIGGQASVTGASTPLDVYRYHRYRVGHTCHEDPHGTDCRS